MKRIVAIYCVLVAVLVIHVSNSFAAEGWTSFGTITNIQADAGGFNLNATVSNNTSICTKKKIFYYHYSSGQSLGNRLYATLLTAYVNQSQIRLYVGDHCNKWGQTNITAINIE